MDKQEFLNKYMKKSCVNHYQKFWAGTALENGLTIEYDGKKLLVKPEQITCNDLGDMSGRCLCGHAIRYEYWFDNVGPIGSKCITTMTGLSGTDLRMIIRGSQYALKERDELAKLIEQYGTLEKQLETFTDLKARIDYLHKEDKIPEAVQVFIENNMPIPYPIRRIIDRLYDEANHSNHILTRYGREVYEMCDTYFSMGNNIRELVGEYEKGVEKSVINTLFDLGQRVVGLKASPAQLDLFRKIYYRLQDQRFVTALDVLATLKGHDLGDFWNNIVTENFNKAMIYGLSEGQLNFILDKTSAGKPGLAIRFKDKLKPIDVEHEQIMKKIEQQDKLVDQIAAEDDEEPAPPQPTTKDSNPF